MTTGTGRAEGQGSVTAGFGPHPATEDGDHGNACPAKITIRGPVTQSRHTSRPQDAIIPGTPDDDDRMGESLVAADFDGDGYDDIAVGVPGETLSGIDEAGAVNIIRGNSGGLTSWGSQFLRQGWGGIVNAPGAYDRFGYALTASDSVLPR